MLSSLKSSSSYYYHTNFVLRRNRHSLLNNGRDLLGRIDRNQIWGTPITNYQRVVVGEWGKGSSTRRISTSISLSSTKATTTSSSLSPEDEEERKKEWKKMKKEKAMAARKKRREMIGIGSAKAVDRGQYSVTYKPLMIDNKFVSLSGLPSSCTINNENDQLLDNEIIPNQTPKKPYFTVLGIESSCDDTGAAIVDSYGNILGESLAKQNDIHQEYGGVVPGLAKIAHENAINNVIMDALKKANITSIEKQIDAIGVTVGPGLEICLRVGCEKAKELAIQYNKPFVGVHHLEAHILMARLPVGTTSTPIQQQQEQQSSGAPLQVEFPFLALLVSGGHCQLLKCYGIGKYTIIGGTLDDSLGEAYDKTARLLGLPVGGGGGPVLEKLALDGDPVSIALPIPLQRRHKSDCNFSYAGLKTAVRVAAQKLLKQRIEEQQLQPEQENSVANNSNNDVDTPLESVEDLPYQDKANIAASFQHVAIRHLEQRLERAIDSIEKEEMEEEQQVTDTNNTADNSDIATARSSKKIRTVALVGGVAANQQVRSRLEAICENRNWNMIVPPPKLCTDQGTMSAWAAVERLNVGSSDNPHGQEVYARYPFSSSSPSDSTI